MCNPGIGGGGGGGGGGWFLIFNCVKQICNFAHGFSRVSYFNAFFFPFSLLLFFLFFFY